MEPMRNLERGLELTLAASMLLAACGPQEGAKTPDPSKIDQLIPSPTAEAPLFDENDRTESVEIYQSERLNACAFHPFDQNKLALEPLVAVNCEVEVGTNSLTVGGSLMNPNPGMASLYENPDGSSGYTVTTQMKVTEVEQWMSEADLSEAEEAQVAKAIEQTRKTDGIVDVTLSTKLNVAKGPDGKDRLVNMGLSVILATDEAATSAALNDTLKPLTESDLLGSQQIAGVDFVPKTNGEWKATLTTYPADWVEVGDSTFVSPEFVALQEKVAAAGERYTLTPQGTIEDQTDQGVTVLPGIKATPEGEITLATKEGNITLPASSVVFDENGALTIEGYEYVDGVWQKAVATITEAKWNSMNSAEKAKYAEENAPKELEDGSTLSADRAGTVLIYRNEKGELTTGWDVVKGEVIGEYETYEAILAAAGLDKDNAWGRDDIVDDIWYVQRDMGIVFINPGVEQEVVMENGKKYVGLDAIAPDKNDGRPQRFVASFNMYEPSGAFYNNIDWAQYFDIKPENVKFGKVYRVPYMQEVLTHPEAKPLEALYNDMLSKSGGKNPFVAMKAGEAYDWPDGIWVHIDNIHEGFPDGGGETSSQQ